MPYPLPAKTSEVALTFDKEGAGAFHSRVDTMNAPCAKIDHCAPAGSLHHALSFGRQQRLDMDLVHQVRLDELASWQRGDHLEDRLCWQKRVPSGERKTSL